MPTSTVRLCQEDVVNVSKDLIRPSGWQCEWNITGHFNKPVMCRIMLTSWQAYLKHLLIHCREYRHENKNTYGCRLPRCSLASGITPTSYNDLIKHLEHSHLNRSALQCPIKGCNSVSFTRHTALEKHFMDEHPEVLDTIVTRPSPLLQPSWKPFYPIHVEIPPLPTSVLPGLVILPAIQGSWRGRPSTPKNLVNENGVNSSPKKLAKMDSWEVKPKPREESPDEAHDFEFDDLEIQYIKQGDQILPKFLTAEQCVIRPEGPHYDLARPQPQLDPNEYGHRVLPATILYDAWRRQHESEFVFTSSEDEKDEGEGGCENENENDSTAGASS
ncbi:hypothetical protein JR316_0008246 [Psilocybe cubensis]|uniref:C2H2-type domain-containing protein n=2 Tax=Psilocybe cubensis TaxID=181762 RepID=A0A8H7XVA9_PSICU|nr:hypothetical protein JR316_0008246 [Psilocybe cubensis]KAH9479651.1 hypothetical protein JR316_0008246 [Psilocybe cubensis]